jgi:alpha-1,6-mannosyltransferase
VAVLLAYLAFTAAVLVSRNVAGRRPFWVVLGGTALFIATLVPTNPAASQDVYHNIADSRTLWIYGDNPALTPPGAHPDDPLFKFVPDWKDTSTSYGPLWYAMSGAPIPFAGTNLWANVIGQKVLASAFLMASVVLVMLIVGRIDAGAAATSGILVGWNPLLLFESAGAAHNDFAMVTFALAALYAVARRWWPGVFPMLALAGSVKYVMVILAPLLLCWMIMSKDIPRKHIALSAAGGLIVGLAVYAPFLADGAWLEALRGEGNHYLSSTGTALMSVLMVQRKMSLEEATRIMRFALVGAFGIGYLALLVQASRRPSYRWLATTAAASIFLFLITVKWWFWPWYLAWLIPVAALAPRRGMAVLASLFSMTAMLLYAAYDWNVYDDWHHTQRLVFMTVFAAPLALACLLLLHPPASRLRDWIASMRRSEVLAED